MDLFLKHHFIAMKQRTQNYNEISCIEVWILIYLKICERLLVAFGEHDFFYTKEERLCITTPLKRFLKHLLNDY